MPLHFTHFELPGHCGAPRLRAPEPVAQRTHFAGVAGDSEITLGSGCRPLEVVVWIYDASYPFTEQQLTATLKFLDNQVLKHGTLSVSGGHERTFRNCTFEGFEPHERGPLPDVAGGLGGGWWIEGVCRFTQLLAAED